MILHVILRTYDGSNGKARPEWYSRAVCLRSLKSALAAVDVPVRFTVCSDGPLPADLAPLLAETDEVVHISGGNVGASFREAVNLAATFARAAPDDTFYWVSEDDYLYRDDSMTALVAAVQACPDVPYFALYTVDTDEWYDSSPTHRALRFSADQCRPRTVGAVAWRRMRGTTSTLGVRRRVLLEDARTLKVGTFAENPFDGATWHILQRHRPYSWRLFGDLGGNRSRRGIAKVVFKPPLRVFMNALAAVRRLPERVLLAPVDNLAVHAEIELLPEGTTWTHLAERHAG